MNSTIACMLESETKLGLGMEILTENEKAYNELEEATQDLRNLLGYTVEKVCLNQMKDSDTCYVEFANNLERYMEDQKIYTVEEAITNIAENYGLLEEDITIVVDESCFNKLDIGALAEKYSVVKK